MTMRQAFAALACLAPTLLAGCIDLAPAYHRPPSPSPPTFPSGPAYAPAVGPAQAAVGWRDFFADPKLRAVIEQALANNRDLRVAMANVVVARAQYHVQRAYLFPTITANAQATYLHEPASVVGGGVFASAVPGGAGSPSAFNEKLFSLTAGTSNYEVDLFGKLRDLSRAALERYFATQQARDAAQSTLVSEVAGDYLAIGADRAQLAIAADTETSSAASLDLIRRRFGTGVDSQLDVSQAETILQQAKFDVARLTTQVAQDRNALELVVGAPVSDDLLPTGVGASVAVLERPHRPLADHRGRAGAERPGQRTGHHPAHGPRLCRPHPVGGRAPQPARRARGRPGRGARAAHPAERRRLPNRRRDALRRRHGRPDHRRGCGARDLRQPERRAAAGSLRPSPGD